MKKFFALILALVMALSLVACGSAPADGGEGNAPAVTKMRFVTGGESGTYYAFGGTIAECASKYPDVKFVALDVSKGDLLEGGVALKGESYDYNPDNWNLTDYVYMDNVYCAVYQEEISGYMAGYAAVKLGYTKLGFLGGMAVPAVIRYGYGFVQGADAAAAELGITIDMKYALSLIHI